MEEFSTFQPPFNQEKINFLLETAKANMKKNKETLLREINKAAVRRQNKRQEVWMGLSGSKRVDKGIRSSCSTVDVGQS